MNTPASPASPGPLACMTLHPGVVYGPVVSRRFGTSLGINLLPALRKLCSFNCVYCQYGWTDTTSIADADWPSVEGVVSAVGDSVARLSSEGLTIDRWTIAGHGEPTLHPEFPAVVEALRVLRDDVAKGTPIGVLSNSSTAHVPGIRDALGRLDERGMKLDAGTQDALRHVNATATPIAQIIEALATLPDIAVQAMFVREPRGRIDNATPAAVEAWLGAIARIRPREVQVYTLARGPAWAGLEAVPADRLEAIAAQVRRLGVPAHAFV